eukprot:g6197.t1
MASLKEHKTAAFSVLGPSGEAQSAAAAGGAAAPAAASSIDELIAAQGDAIRALKAGKAPKAQVDAAVQVLLQLKGIGGGAAAGAAPVLSAPASAPAPAPAAGGGIEAQVAAQGDKVRQLKKDKAPKDEIKAAVAVLLGLKKQAEDAAKAAPPAAAAPAAAADGGKGEQKVTPWEVEGSDEGIDYDKLIRDFGSSKIEPTLIQRFEQITGERAHHWLRRGLFFSHREMDVVLNKYEKGDPFYLYTGRGPSSEALHLGHLIPFTFTRYLQRVFKVPLVIQLTDDEKFLFKKIELDECHRLAYQNAKDIIACGFEQEKTFMFSDLDYIHHMYPTICRIQKMVTFNQSRGIFGFEGSTNIGCVSFPAIQACPSFAPVFATPLGGVPAGDPNAIDAKVLKKLKRFQCLIPCAIDQDPYFRMTRDVAPRLKMLKPALIHSKFFPALQGSKTKMSASSSSSSIYMTDTPKQIKKKINSFAFSGGGKDIETQRKFGANLDVDVAYQYLTFFMEDDERLAEIGRDYQSGKMMTGQVKSELVGVLTDLVKGHQARKADVTDDVVKKFMEVRPLTF